MELSTKALRSARERERRRLRKYDILDRPWFILGSAPEPTIPEGITDHSALICINNSVVTAAQTGLRLPDLTFRARASDWQPVAGYTLPLVLLMNESPPFGWRRLLQNPPPPDVNVGKMLFMPRRVRRTIYTELLGSDLGDIGQKHKPSGGVFAMLYGSLVGIPQIIFGGFSLDRDGYSYSARPRVRAHRDEDHFAMKMIARTYPTVSTTEARISQKTGIPLHTSA
jgi:hypothetical protein